MSDQVNPVGGDTKTGEDARRYQCAVDALNRGQWREAQRVSMSMLHEYPSHAGVSFVAGVAALQMEQVPLALELLKRAVALNPHRPDYLTQYARALAAGRFSREAEEIADRAFALQTQDALTLDTLGVVYSQSNSYTKAARAFSRAAELQPERAGYRFNLATSLTFAGSLDEAEREYEACLRLDPRYWKAWLALSQLRKQTATDNHIERLRVALGEAETDLNGQMYLNLALSKELEDLDDYPLSFEHLVIGKRAGRHGRAYSTERDRRIFEALMASSETVSSGRDGHANSEPIFVVGMPRSGTTLVERILSSHSAVSSAGELQNFGVALKRASGSRTQHMLDVETITAANELDWARLGATYVASTRPGTGHKRHFVDKLPHNFLYAGFIARALPDAKIICLRRDPMDVCLSNFRQLFALTSPYYDYSFDLMDTGHYFLMFDRLMAHWHASMPGRILEVRYEELVDNQETVTRELLAWCGLGWEDACLRFQDNDAPVATASAVQVRSPMFRTSLQRWKRYGSRMDELYLFLKSAGVLAGPR